MGGCMIFRGNLRSYASVFALGLGVLVGGPRPIVAEIWTPASVGNEWSYRISETTRYSIGGEAISRESKTGRYLREITETSHHANVPVPVFVFEEVRAWKGAAASNRTSSLGALRSGAFLEYAMDAGEGLTLHESPLIYVPAGVKGGMSWEVGTLELQGLKVELQGEILGLQTARTPAGPFERCLKIRYTGAVSGLVELENGRLPVRKGQLDMTHWFAPGVGLVMAEETIRMDLLTAQGTMTSTLTDRYALEHYQVDGAPVPAHRTP